MHKNVDKLVLLVEMLGHAQSDLGCFVNGGVNQAISELRQRLGGVNMTRKECENFADELISQADGNWRTLAYDRF